MLGLRSEMNEALVELVYDDPLNAWQDIPVLELDGPLDGRLGAVLAALDQARRHSPRNGMPLSPPGPAKFPAGQPHHLAQRQMSGSGSSVWAWCSGS